MTTTHPLAEQYGSLYRDMLRFARLQLRDEAAAEDAVQEAFASAYEKHDSFAGKSSLRTWVFSILRNKIIDALRARRGIEIPAADMTTDAFFDDEEHWTEEAWPSEWGDPEQSLEAQQFWTVFEACLYRLQEAAARAFMLREMMGFETDEICATLKITTSNCGVLLHRARLALRACLEHKWFLQPSGAQ